MLILACLNAYYYAWGLTYHRTRLRRQGLKVKAFERAPNLGGIWYRNCYPGARVDSDYSVYQYSGPDIWKDWTWSERFPGWEELREYYKHVDSKWHISSNVEFNTAVTGAPFDEGTHNWTLSLSTGETVRAHWFVPALGFASKKYVPNYRGLESFKGVAVHTDERPRTGLDLENKRVAVVGTGASGVQVIQEIASQAKHMTVYQRTANLALPMFQTKISKSSEDIRKADGTYEQTFGGLRKSRAGFEFALIDQAVQDVSPEERR